MTNSIHDMGGMHGFGPVVAETDEPPFHERWEGRLFAMQRSMGFTGLWTIDAGRASLEALPPLDYLGSSYYRRWFLGLEKRLLQRNLVGRRRDRRRPFVARRHAIAAKTHRSRCREAP